jgi:hypothetical protein
MLLLSTLWNSFSALVQCLETKLLEVLWFVLGTKCSPLLSPHHWMYERPSEFIFVIQCINLSSGNSLFALQVKGLVGLSNQWEPVNSFYLSFVPQKGRRKFGRGFETPNILLVEKWTTWVVLRLTRASSIWSYAIVLAWIHQVLRSLTPPSEWWAKNCQDAFGLRYVDACIWTTESKDWIEVMLQKWKWR